MGKFRKKPVVIEAFRLEDLEYPEWFSDAVLKNIVTFPVTDGITDTIIKTLEGDHKVSYGDYIIKGIKGELYPCKSDIFEATYDKVD